MQGQARVEEGARDSGLGRFQGRREAEWEWWEREREPEVVKGKGRERGSRGEGRN